MEEWRSLKGRVPFVSLEKVSVPFYSSARA